MAKDQTEVVGRYPLISVSTLGADFQRGDFQQASKRVDETKMPHMSSTLGADFPRVDFQRAIQSVEEEEVGEEVEEEVEEEVGDEEEEVEEEVRCQHEEK